MKATLVRPNWIARSEERVRTGNEADEAPTKYVTVFCDDDADEISVVGKFTQDQVTKFEQCGARRDGDSFVFPSVLVYETAAGLCGFGNRYCEALVDPKNPPMKHYKHRIAEKAIAAAIATLESTSTINRVQREMVAAITGSYALEAGGRDVNNIIENWNELLRRLSKAAEQYPDLTERSQGLGRNSLKQLLFRQQRLRFIGIGELIDRLQEGLPDAMSADDWAAVRDYQSNGSAGA